MLVAALTLGLATATAPANPLGNGCVTSQYSNLNNPSVVGIPFDVSSASSEPNLNYLNPPSFLALARKEVSSAWSGFLKSVCNTPPATGMVWAGNCRPFVSKLRDTLNVYSAVYPGAGGQYGFDPWWVIQEDVAHRGYYLTGDYLDLFGLTGNDAQKAEKYQLIVNWYNAWRGAIGSDGTKKFGAVTYDQYVRLSGPVCQDGSTPTDAKPCTYTHRAVLDQFWGATAMAKPEYGAYENLGYLFKVVQDSALDGPTNVQNARWDVVMAATDLTKNDGTAAAPVYKIHDEFHELRKQIRAMWRNLQMHPEIMPAAWTTLTIPSTQIPLWSWDLMKTKIIDGHEVLKAFFDNDAKHIAYFKSWGWSDSMIWLGTTMALGGYFHEDLVVAPSPDYIGSQMRFDLVERMGWINDELMTFKYGVAAGKDAVWVAAQRTKINDLWAALKLWFIRNDMQNRLRDIATYIPAPHCAQAVGSDAAADTTTKSVVVPLIIAAIIALLIAGSVVVFKKRNQSRKAERYMSMEPQIQAV